MLTPVERRSVGGVTRTLQIIVGALFAGVLSYLVFVLVAAPPPGAPAGGISLALMGIAFAAAAVIAAAVVPRILAAQCRATMVADRGEARAVPSGLPTGDVGRLLGDFQVRRIIAGALLEGGAFFNVFAYQMERQTYTLGIVIALLLGLLTLIPLRPLVEQWLERELRTVRELRDLQR
jgi:MFS family permease